MADPNTVNVGLIVPNRGSFTGTWDLPINGDMVAIDGMIAGVATIGLSNAPVTLTAPAGSITPAPGPTQSQNAVIRLTGTLTGNVQVTLPLPGPIIVENLTTGNFVVTMKAVSSGEIIGIDQGVQQQIYNDGTNVRFVNLGRPSRLEFWSGISAMPAWVNACTVKPYLLCDGSIYNFSDYPYLGPKLGNAFGGNGINTFAVPDTRGRVPLAYDGTGTRITTAGSGLNGQTMGAAIDSQSIILTAAQIPAHTHPNTLNDPGHAHNSNPNSGYLPPGGAANGQVQGPNLSVIPQALQTSINTTNITINNAANTGGGGAHPNLQPSLVAGIYVIKT